MTKRDFDVVALGELLIDFTENGASEQSNPLFEANPGGAPCNVLAMLKKLGKRCAFIGKVGNDMFGTQLRTVAQEVGICMDALTVDVQTRTTLAFVKTFANGDRDFSFYRNPGADMMLTPEDIPKKMVTNTRVFHFGTLSLTHEPVRSATRRAVALAKEAGAVISFDPNLRPPLWDSLEDAKEQIAWGLAQCDVLKIADNELEFMTSETDFDRGAAILQKQYPTIRLLNATAGADGSCSYYGDIRTFQPSFRLGGTIETTGAGDAFCACVLNFVLEHGLDGLTKNDLDRMLRFANAAAYLVTTKKGAIRLHARAGTGGGPVVSVADQASSCHSSRKGNQIMPLLDDDSEFALKRQALCQSHVEEGIRDPIRVYEYMNRYYVEEGNKRVSVRKFFGADTAYAHVIRILPERNGTKEVELYYKFMDFERYSRVNYVELTGQLCQTPAATGQSAGGTMD